MTDKPRTTRRRSTSPTMVQVAKAAQVSIFTVSAVVNGTSTVSEELRARTERAIKETGYKRNNIARSLKTGKTKTVGVLVGDIRNSFYTDVFSIIQQELHKAGYAVMLCCNESNVTLQEEQVALMRDRMVDGLIISPTGDDRQMREAVSETNVPIILIDRIVKGVDCDVVVLNNKAAAREAVRHVIGLGHRRIGFVSGLIDTYTGRERFAGYLAALDEAGILRDAALIQHGNFPEDGSRMAAIELLSGPAPPTAILAVNNRAVLGVTRALNELGKECPADVSLVGIDDFLWADYFRPRLTTIAQPVHEFAEQSVRMLLDRMHGDVRAPRRVVLEGQLVVRSSCGAAPG